MRIKTCTSSSLNSIFMFKPQPHTTCFPFSRIVHFMCRIFIVSFWNLLNFFFRFSALFRIVLAYSMCIIFYLWNNTSSDSHWRVKTEKKVRRREYNKKDYSHTKWRASERENGARSAHIPIQMLGEQSQTKHTLFTRKSWIKYIKHQLIFQLYVFNRRLFTYYRASIETGSGHGLPVDIHTNSFTDYTQFVLSLYRSNLFT